MGKKIRLDELVLARGFASSRSEAKALVMTGKVRLGTVRLDKAGVKVDEDLDIEVEAGRRFVGRGGEKLLGYIEKYGLSFEDCNVLDVGASTGGFTDCSLQNGAASATCVDVGKGQLHAKLRDLPQVTNLEKVNARYLQVGDLPHEKYDRIVMDLSFISLKSVLPAIWPFLDSNGVLIALVKPQFEVGKAIADKFRGVIKDESEREKALEGVRSFALENLENAKVHGLIHSPIKGADGNVEYLLGLVRTNEGITD